jgi:two-component system LytT family sensor kinase
MKRSLDIKLVKFYLWVGVVYISFWVLGDSIKYPGSFFLGLLNNLWRLPYLIVLNYTFFEYTIPFVFRKKRTVVFNILLAILALWIYMMLWSYGMYGWRSLGVLLHIYTPLIIIEAHKIVEGQMGYVVGSVFFFGISRLVYNNIILKQATQQLAIEKKEAELNYLKSQTNPHFLFNTLNNIYSLTRDKSDLAPESILRLSKILRFMLYEAGGDYISIEQELKIVTDYIELEKLRYDESLQINFNYDVENMKQAIPPLLLIPLVENAFKHGVSETRGNPFVDIHLSIRNRQLTFVVKNSTETGSEERTIQENIGLSNLRRQLELLYEDYNLSVQHGDGAFTAVLKINLASNVENKLHHNRR